MREDCDLGLADEGREERGGRRIAEERREWNTSREGGTRSTWRRGRGMGGEGRSDRGQGQQCAGTARAGQAMRGGITAAQDGRGWENTDGDAGRAGSHEGDRAFAAQSPTGKTATGRCTGQKIPASLAACFFPRPPLLLCRLSASSG